MDTKTGNKDCFNLVTVKTDQLRERLNRLYEVVRGNPRTLSYWGRFDYLWDLKEMALLEKQSSVQIPDTWLEELEQMFSQYGPMSERGH